MVHRREALLRLGLAALLPGTLGAQGVRDRSRKSPAIDRPILFDTPEADKILEDLQVFPPDNPWNVDISRWPVHPNSRNIIASIGTEKPFRYNTDMGFVLVPPDQRRVEVRIEGYGEESDRGPFPVPDTMPIEGWPASYRRDPKLKDLSLGDVQRDTKGLDGDRHAIVVDPANRMLHEFYNARRTAAGWEARQASTFDLKSNKLRPEGWTSTDAAGLPIFPAIVRYDELRRGMITHALRVTVTRSRRAYVHPATHFASRNDDPNLPRMGERIRLRRDFESKGFTPEVKTILKALKSHGMFVADNGIDWAISVAPDERIPVLHEELRRVKGSDFEVVQPPK
ncbi:MAG TPA: hypothetical protein VG406_19885 [Isosphaeraceae bacterium]|jgi:hypothetical protein|nr:hypothetical protein [Isosphaeraceae bacterium]